ncbi:MAG: hypothetical protein GY754_14930 [bacterium]|nr:hypothetical protein [bacterium]
MHYDEIITFPKEIGMLKNLKYFDISSNKLRGLPQEIAQLKKLKYLELVFNDYLNQKNFLKIKKWLPNCDINNGSMGMHLNKKGEFVIWE